MGSEKLGHIAFCLLGYNRLGGLHYLGLDFFFLDLAKIRVAKNDVAFGILKVGFFV